MNKNIEKLYLETTGKDWTYEFDPILAEKFAEMIIEKCIHIVNVWSDEESCSDGYDIMPVYKLKEYFGIDQ